MKKLITVCTSMVAVVASATSITGISANQRWPWNNLMDVDFTLSDSTASMAYRIELSATYNNGANKVYARSYLTEPIVEGDGAKRVTWDLGADCPELKADDFTVSVTATPLVDNDIPVFMVIDLSTGANSTKYPVRYTTTPPDLSDDTCRTTEMWLRRIKAGTFKMGGAEGGASGSSVLSPAKTITLTKDFYMAIFETTQQQWYQVMGTWPSYHTNMNHRATRPVEQIMRDDVRGPLWVSSNSGLTAYKWPEDGHAALPSSFVGRIQANTGISTFDLPTEAQWEYACWAGTHNAYPTTAYGRFNENGGKLNDDRNVEAVANATSSDSYGTAKVGSYLPNAWGLYDMFGNVWEIVLDRWMASSWPSDVVDYDDYGGPSNAQGGAAGQVVVKSQSCTWGTYYGARQYRRNNEFSSKYKSSTCGARFCVTLE